MSNFLSVWCSNNQILTVTFWRNINSLLVLFSRCCVVIDSTKNEWAQLLQLKPGRRPFVRKCKVWDSCAPAATPVHPHRILCLHELDYQSQPFCFFTPSYLISHNSYSIFLVYPLWQATCMFFFFMKIKVNRILKQVQDYYIIGHSGGRCLQHSPGWTKTGESCGCMIGGLLGLGGLLHTCICTHIHAYTPSILPRKTNKSR